MVPEPVRSVLRRLWIVLLLGALGAGAAVAYTALTTAQYDATASVLVEQTSGLGAAASAAGATQGGIDMVTEIQVAGSDVVAQDAQVLLRTTTSVSDLQAALGVTSPANSAVLDMTFTAAKPRAAQAGAQAFAQAYLDLRASAARRDLQQQVAALQQQQARLTASLNDLAARSATSPPNSAQKQSDASDQQVLSQEVGALDSRLSSLTATPVVSGSIVTPATLPTAPSSPSLPLDVAVGLVLGCLLGVGLALLLGRSDRRIRSAGQLGALTGPAGVLEVLAPRVGTLLSGQDLQLRSFGLLRALLLATAGSHDEAGSDQVRVVVTGVRPHGSVGYLTANLAAACARAGRRTVLLLGDPDSTAAALLGATSTEAGLSAVLSGGAVPAPQRTPTGVHVLGVGASVADRDLLGSIETLHHLEQLGQDYDVVLVQTPPPALSTTAQSLAAAGFWVVPVVERGRDRLPDVEALVTEVEQVGGEVLGIVLVHERASRRERRQAATAPPPAEQPPAEQEVRAPAPAGG